MSIQIMSHKKSQKNWLLIYDWVDLIFFLVKNYEFYLMPLLLSSQCRLRYRDTCPVKHPELQVQHLHLHHLAVRELADFLPQRK